MEDKVNCSTISSTLEVLQEKPMAERIVLLDALEDQLETRKTHDTVLLGQIWTLRWENKVWKHDPNFKAEPYTTNIDAFRAYCKHKGSSYSTANLYMNIYKNFHDLDLEGITVRKLQTIIPVVDEDNRLEWIEAARNGDLDEEQLRNNVRQAKGKTVTDDHEHEWIEVCRKCSKARPPKDS